MSAGRNPSLALVDVRAPESWSPVRSIAGALSETLWESLARFRVDALG
jgi:hypothetical protein